MPRLSVALAAKKKKKNWKRQIKSNLCENVKCAVCKDYFGGARICPSPSPR